MTVKFYKVGGCVRDALLERKCNDIDYSVEAPSFGAMRQEIIERGGEVFLESPQYLTIRAKVPNMGACDFVLCRKDGDYSDGRRPNFVEQGTILDDLARRDFTMNAIAEDGDGAFIDPHRGIVDIGKRVIRCVGEAHDRFEEDSLRVLRALRFAVTLGFELDNAIHDCLCDNLVTDGLMFVSTERIREELLKAFKVDTLATMKLLNEYPNVAEVIFAGGGLWLMPTLKGVK